MRFFYAIKKAKKIHKKIGVIVISAYICTRNADIAQLARAADL